MKKKNIEIEIKVKVEKVKPLIKFLKKKGRLISQGQQIDRYFTPIHRNFIAVRPTKEWLRLRNNKEQYSINYKNWHFNNNGKTYHCDEHETTIIDGNQMENIFQALDIKPIITVDKKRQIWIYKDYEIAIDRVGGLGDFVEVEFKGKNEVDPKNITIQMVQFLKDTGCGNIRRNYQGYPFLLLFPDEAKYEDQ